jgi:hypothetical protein
MPVTVTTTVVKLKMGRSTMIGTYSGPPVFIMSNEF